MKRKTWNSDLAQKKKFIIPSFTMSVEAARGKSLTFCTFMCNGFEITSWRRILLGYFLERFLDDTITFLVIQISTLLYLQRKSYY